MSQNEVKITSEVQQFAEITVNGNNLGKRKINGGPSLTEFVSELAREHGIRTFTVTVDDAPVTSSRASEPVADGQRVSVSAKDSRGAGAKKAAKSEPVAEATEAPAATEGTQGEAAPASDAPASEEAATKAAPAEGAAS